MPAVRSLRERKVDWFFIACFSFGVFSCLFADLYVALDWVDADSIWAELNRKYLEKDPFMASDPYFVRILVRTSAFVWLPCYLIFIYALIRGRNWVRPLALLYVGGMTVNMVNFLYFELAGPLPPTEHMVYFLGWNLPYLIVPLLFGLRVRQHKPFTY